MSNLAEQFEENEQFDKAYEEYKKMYSQRPKSIEILQSLGHLAVILNKKEEAVEYYNKILELDMTSTLAHEQLMDLYVHTDRYKYYVARGNLHIVEQLLSHAINDFKKALTQAQETEEMSSCHFVLATLYEQTGKPHQAIDEYLRILDSGNTNAAVYLKLAKIYENEDAVQSAVEILERARSSDFDTIEIKEYLAKLYLKNNQPSKAIELSEDKMVKVRGLLDADKNREAFDILNSVASKDKNAKFYSLLAQYYYNNKEWDKSLETVKEFDKLENNSPLTYQMRALIYEEKGDDFNSHINWAKFSLTKKDLDVALNEYFAAYQVKNDDANLVREIAELLEDTGDKNHAAEFYEKLLELTPNDKKALQKMAEFKENIGDYADAANFLDKLCSIDSKNTVMIKKLAGLYEKLRNKAKAVEYYQKFISLSPVNDEYEAIVQKLAKLENTEMEQEEGFLDKLMNMFAKK